MRRSCKGDSGCTEYKHLPKLHKAAYAKDVAKLKRLLNNPTVSVNERDFNGRTVLHYACLSGCCDVLREVLQHANPLHIEARDRKGRTPIFMAIESDSFECTELMTSHNADVNIKDINGTPLLHYAVRRNNTMIVNHLIASRAADIEMTDKNAFSALHVSCALGLTNMTQILISHDAAVDPIGWKERTPLMAATAGGFEEIVEMLLKCNASLTHADQDGMKAADWAKKRHNKNIKRLIEKTTIRRRFLRIFQTSGGSKQGKEDDNLEITETANATKRESGVDPPVKQQTTFFKAIDSVFGSKSQVNFEQKFMQESYVDLSCNLSSRHSHPSVASDVDMSKVNFDGSETRRSGELNVEYVTENADSQKIDKQAKQDCHEKETLDNMREVNFATDSTETRVADCAKGGARARNETKTKEPITDYKQDSNTTPPQIKMTVYPDNVDEEIFELELSLSDVVAKPESKEYLINYDGLAPTSSMECLISQQAITVHAKKPRFQTNDTNMDHLWVSDSEANESNYEMKQSFKRLANSSQSSSESDLNSEYVIASKINSEISIDGDASGFFIGNNDKPIEPEMMSRDEYQTYSNVKVQRLKDKNKRLTADITNSVQDAFILECRADDLEDKLKRTVSIMHLEKARADKLLTQNAELGQRVDELMKEKGEMDLELEKERGGKRKNEEKIEMLMKNLEAISHQDGNGSKKEDESMRKKLEWLVRMKIKLEMELEEERRKSCDFEVVKKDFECTKNECERLEEKLDSKTKEINAEYVKAEKQEKMAETSRKYYEQKLIKMNKERVEQLREISKLKEAFSRLSQELKTVRAKKIEAYAKKKRGKSGVEEEDGNCADSEEGEVLEGVEGSKEGVVGGADDENKLGEASEKDCLLVEVSKKCAKIRAQEIELKELKNQMEIAMRRVKENENKQSVMRKQIHQRRLGEELKQRFLLKGEELQQDLSKLRVDLKYEKEKRRRLQLSDEIKNRFVDLSENLQKELAQMKTAQKDWMDEKLKMCKELEAKDVKISEYGDVENKVQDQEEIIKELRNGISYERQQQSFYMKTYYSIKSKAEMYDELVGSNLQLEEKISNIDIHTRELEAENNVLKQRYTDKQNEAGCYQAALIGFLSKAEGWRARLAEKTNAWPEGMVDTSDNEQCKVLLNITRELKKEIYDATTKLRDDLEAGSLALESNIQGSGYLRSLSNESHEKKGVESENVPRWKEKEIKNDDDHDGENVIRELWKARMLVEKLTNESEELKEEKRNLTAKVEAYKELAAKHCQNEDDMISLQEVLEENAMLMEENAAMAKKYSEKIEKHETMAKCNECSGNAMQDEVKEHALKEVAVVKSSDVVKNERDASEKSGNLGVDKVYMLEKEIQTNALQQIEKEMQTSALQHEKEMQTNDLQQKEKEMQTNALQQHEKEMQTIALQQKEKEMQTNALQQNEKEMQTNALQQHEKEMQTNDLQQKEKEMQTNALQQHEKEMQTDALQQIEKKVQTNALQQHEKEMQTNALQQIEKKVQTNALQQKEKKQMELQKSQEMMQEKTNQLEAAKAKNGHLEQEMKIAELRLKGAYTENKEVRIKMDGVIFKADNTKYERDQLYLDLIRANEEIQAVMHKNASYMSDMKHARDRYEKLDEENELLKCAVKRLNTRIVELESECGMLKESCEEAKVYAESKLAELGNVMSEASDESSIAEKKNKELECELELSEEKNRCLKVEVSALEEDCRTIRKELEDIKERIQSTPSTEKELAEIREEYDILTKDNDTLKLGHESALAEISDYKKIEARLEEELSCACSNAAKNNEEVLLKEKVIEEERSKSKVLFEELTTTRSMLSESERKLKRTAKNYVKMKQRYLDCESETECLKESLANKELNLGQKIKQLQLLAEENQVMEEENSQLKQMHVSMEEKLETKNKEYGLIQKELSEVKSKWKTELRGNKELNEELSETKQYIEVLKDKMAQLTAAKVAGEERFARLQQNLKKETGTEFASHCYENEQRKNEINGLHRVIDGKEESYETVTSKLHTFQMANQDLENQLSLSKIRALSTKVKSLENENVELNEKILICLKENDQTSRNLKIAEYRLDISQTRNNELWSQYRETRKQFKETITPSFVTKYHVHSDKFQ
eukprot:gene18726-20615_t